LYWFCSEVEIAMSEDAVARARGFLLLNGRLLERRLFAHAYEDGSAEAVVAALEAYRNADGGFGNALEPDKRAPPSQPQDAEVALRTLDAVGALTPERALPLCDWLASATTPAGGVPFSLPSVNPFPHSPWWGVAEDHSPANLNPTAAIVGLLLKHRIDHPWIRPATDYCWSAIAASESADFHEIACVEVFLSQAPDRVRADRLLRRIVERVAAPGVVALDPDATGYVQKPLDFAPTPQSPFRALFDEATIDRHLAALAARQQADGGWPLSWDALSPGVAMEYRGRVTLFALATLRAYGR
jgi:hypothetical protein